MTDTVLNAVFYAFFATGTVFTMIFTWMLCKEEFGK